MPAAYDRLAMPSLEPRVKLWVAFGARTKFGDGRARLLELIHELGSINQAVVRIGMSYRSAWGYIQELEKAAGFQFLERRPGGGARGGARLTGEGRAFLDRYWRFRRGLDQVVSRQFARAFGTATDAPRARSGRPGAATAAPASRERPRLRTGRPRRS
jgi:molybdate transport system regulatory protein